MCPSLDHSQDVICIHPVGSEIVPLAGAAKEPAFFVVTKESERI
jgi:hypothetical protein